jgi:mono/diheme cytochrome c family protein
MNTIPAFKRGLGGRLLLVATVLGLCFPVGCQQTQSRQPAASPDSRGTAVSSGQHLYVSYCASCHGLDGKGNGPASSALRTAPTDLTLLSKNNHGSFPAERVYSMASGDYVIASHGSKEMPIWGPAFLARSGSTPAEVEQNIRSLVRYIELLQQDLVAELRERRNAP